MYKYVYNIIFIWNELEENANAVKVIHSVV